MSDVRQDLVQSAVSFLSDTKVQQAPLGKRIAFLESKGLTKEEIQAALDQTTGESVASAARAAGASAGGNSNSLGNSGAAGPPAIPPRTAQSSSWKDAVISLAGVGGITYLLYKAAEQYLGPFFDFPTPKALKNQLDTTRKEMDMIQKTIDSVSAQTNELLRVLDKHAQDVADSIAILTKSIETMGDADKERNGQITAIQDEVESVKNMLPKVFILTQLMEKTKETQDNMVADLHSEVKSLKNLLLNRRLTTDTPSGLSNVISSKPSIPAWQLEAVKSKQDEQEESSDKPVEQAQDIKQVNNQQDDLPAEGDPSEADIEHKENTTKKSHKKKAARNRSKSPIRQPSVD